MGKRQAVDWRNKTHVRSSGGAIHYHMKHNTQEGQSQRGDVREEEWLKLKSKIQQLIRNRDRAEKRGRTGQVSRLNALIEARISRFTLVTR